MVQADWKDVVSLAVKLIAREPPPVQIFVWLLVAFAVLMVVEGLRATFLPRRYVSQIQRRAAGSLSIPVGAERPKALSGAPISQTFEARKVRFTPAPPLLARNNRLSAAVPRRQETTKPKIRRISSYFVMAEAEPEISASLPEHLEEHVALEQTQA
jgi:uncharacterized protein YjeT (DUF2065 family)